MKLQAEFNGQEVCPQMLVPSPRSSLSALVGANLACVGIGAAFRWTPVDLITLYWLELIVLGFVTVLQMRRATQPGAFAKSRGYLIIFFGAHYGTFCVMYRAILVEVFGGDLAASALYWVVVWVPLAALAAAHVQSYRLDFLPREASAVSTFSAMWIPYLRELPLHVPMMLAAALIPHENATRAAVIVFGLGKTLVDAIVHVIHHTRVARPEARIGV